MKKKLLTILFSTMALFPAFGQGKELRIALDYINQGYITFGIQSLKECANRNDLLAQFFLGQCYEYGFMGSSNNSEEAFLLYSETAEQGLPIAQYSVANCYEIGYGTTQSYKKARMWRKKSKGKFDLQDLSYFPTLYQNGLTYPEHYNQNPLEHTNGSNENSSIQTTSNYGSNNTINSNNQSINSINIVQAHTIQPVSQSPTISLPAQPSRQNSDVDQDIPSILQSNENTFALIIANENYQDVAKVPNALNDGEIFAEYCKKTLGLPATNVTLIKDATYNNIKREINRLSLIADAYKGTAKIIFYYAGHGIPDEVTKDAFLLPVDGYGTDISTGYSLRDIYAVLGKMPSEQVVVLLDACFSGSLRGDGMLASARGIAIKAKPNKAEGKMVILSASQGDETAYPYEEQRHGLFTYYLLKKLKESQGSVSLGELALYIKDNVSKKSIVVNGKSQTPGVNSSTLVGESWKNWTLR